MSEALYGMGGLRFWNESEIQLRRQIEDRLALVVKRALLGVNPAWRFFQIDAPVLIPRGCIGAEYSGSDIFVTNHIVSGSELCLRAETTPSSYVFAQKVKGKLPICVWQSGKSFRRETSDGATASKMRYNEFYQLEFQCIYSVGTMADYRGELLNAVLPEVCRYTGNEVRVIPSDRLPAYSESTLDIEVADGSNWREVASCSIRTDYSVDTRVCEIAFGLDRLTEFAGRI